MTLTEKTKDALEQVKVILRRVTGDESIEAEEALTFLEEVEDEANARQAGIKEDMRRNGR